MRDALHLDCWSGLAGDMFLGACLDLGMPAEVLSDAIARLNLDDVSFVARPAMRQGIRGLRFQVTQAGRPIEGLDADEPGHEHHGHSPDSHAHHTHSHHADPPATPHVHGRSLADIHGLLNRSSLAPEIRERAIGLFWRLGEAEGRIHGMPTEAVHFHEVGAIDSIVDLVGAAAAMAWLDPSRVTCGPVNVGSGEVRAAHGALPIPAPATADLLRGVPIYSAGSGELLTPTGAVLLAELVDEFRELPRFSIRAIGYGLGKRDFAGRANAVRILRGDSDARSEAGEVLVVECEIDDLSGEGFGFLLERLFESGALDAYFTPVQMKKNRPGTLVTALCRSERLEDIAAVLVADGGSMGCRFASAARFEAQRETGAVETRYGRVAVKRALFRGRVLPATPEFEDCRRLALDHGVSWREVYRAVIVALGDPTGG